MNIIKASSNSVTEAVGAALARDLKSKGIKRAFVALSGDLGAGKTVFTTGFASVMSPGSRVKSPTYTIVNEYLKGEVPVYHFDFYRISDPDELFGIGFDDYLDSGICIGEWCENIGECVPEDAILIEILKDSDTTRIIKTSYDFYTEDENVDIGI